MIRIIRSNLIGLLNFVSLLLSVFVFPKKYRRREAPDYSDYSAERAKYEALMGGPSEPLLPTEAVFCPKCHSLAAQIRRTEQGVQIIHKGRALITVGSNVTISQGGKEIKGFPVRCPNGHEVRIE